MKKLLTTQFLLAIFPVVSAQTATDFADSSRIKYKMPELAVAVVSADTIFKSQVLGVQRINTGFNAGPDDRLQS